MSRPQLRQFANRHRAALVIGSGVTAFIALQALVSPAQSASTSIPTGQMLSSNCMQCHGTNGMSGSFDQIAGEDAADLLHKLRDFRDEDSIMGAQVRGYTDAELQAIARYFSTLPKP